MSSVFALSVQVEGREDCGFDIKVADMGLSRHLIPERHQAAPSSHPNDILLPLLTRETSVASTAAVDACVAVFLIPLTYYAY